MHVVHTSQRDKDTKNTEIAAAASDTDLSEVVQTFSNNIHPITGEIELGKLTSFLDAPDENTYDAEAETVEAPQEEPAVDKETGEILEGKKEDTEGKLL